jgi:short-subunit dehydrogenase
MEDSNMRAKLHGDVVLVTGASSGIGKVIAEALVKEGYRVYGTSRKANDINKDKPLSESGERDGFLEMIQLDVCSEESAKNAMEHVATKEGRIDILINNAGFGIAGSVEDTSTDEAKEQFETNFFGVHRMVRHVLPVMRKQNKGLIINVSSVAGLITIPYQSMYCASKRAVEALTESLRMECAQFGIKSLLVEPGDTKTGFTGSRIYATAARDSVYERKCKKAVETMEKDEINGDRPEIAANVILSILKKKRPPVRKVIGIKYKVLVFIKRLIPSRLEEFIVSRMY